MHNYQILFDNYLGIYIYILTFLNLLYHYHKGDYKIINQSGLKLTYLTLLIKVFNILIADL